MSGPEELSAMAAARRLGIDLAYLYRLLWSAKLPGRKEGRRWLIPAKAVEERRIQREASNG